VKSNRSPFSAHSSRMYLFSLTSIQEVAIELSSFEELLLLLLLDESLRSFPPDELDFCSNGAYLPIKTYSSSTFAKIIFTTWGWFNVLRKRASFLNSASKVAALCIIGNFFLAYAIEVRVYFCYELCYYWGVLPAQQRTFIAICLPVLSSSTRNTL